MLNFANRMNEPILPQMSEVASSRKLTLRQFDARGPADFDSVMAAMAANVGAFVLLDDAVLIAGAPEIGKLALQRRLPSIGFPDYATAGGLIAFGVNFLDLFRRAAGFVDNALMVCADPLFNSRREQLVALAAHHKVPAMYEFREYVLMEGW